MPEYDSDNPMLPYSHDSQMLEYDDDKQVLQITKTHFTNRQSTSITEEYPLPEPPAAALDGKHSLPEICGLFLNTVPDL